MLGSTARGKPDVSLCPNCKESPRFKPGEWCKDCKRARNRQYWHDLKKNDPVKWRKHHQKKRFFSRRSRTINQKRKPFGKVTAKELRDLWKAQRGRCALTGVKLTRTCSHLDHIVPISRGGKNVISNCRWVHPFPNLSKGSKLDCEAQLDNEPLPF